MYIIHMYKYLYIHVHICIFKYIHIHIYIYTDFLPHEKLDQKHGIRHGHNHDVHEVRGVIVRDILIQKRKNQHKSALLLQYKYK